MHYGDQPVLMNGKIYLIGGHILTRCQPSQLPYATRCPSYPVLKCKCTSICAGVSEMQKNCKGREVQMCADIISSVFTEHMGLYPTWPHFFSQFVYFTLGGIEDYVYSFKLELASLECFFEEHSCLV